MKKRNFVTLARWYLKDMGNASPTNEHIVKMEQMIANVTTLSTWRFTNTLSEREMHCLVLVAHGKTTPEIATQLKIKTSTVNTHRREILRKLKCKTMSHAVFQTMRYNILPYEKRCCNSN